MPNNDLKFFTNEPERDLYSRFATILKSSTQFFDILVGYFRTSGFFRMYPSLETVEKIRVLVGLNVDRFTVKIIDRYKDELKYQTVSTKDGKTMLSDMVEHEFDAATPSEEVEKGVRVFIDWLKSGKLELRMYTESPIHAKVYIMRKDPEKIPDTFGTVITGSSNFSESGLVNNLEFNVELKDAPDVHFALDRFEQLWAKGVDVMDTYIDSVENKTWLRNDVTPYQIYLKTLYEFFREEINADKETFETLLPDGYMRLQYQIDAVTQARQNLEAYNGVFISDVVGLGKTYICAMLANTLNRATYKLFICPPVLVDYWKGVLQEFDVSRFDVVSLGKLDSVIARGTDKYGYVFIDEAHRFRNSGTDSFTKLHEICWGKKVVLISATPINNYTSDIENQIYLFQPKQGGTINGIKNLEGFFRGLNSDLHKHTKGTPDYMNQLRRNSEVIRDKLLREVMIRRTRSEIVQYYIRLSYTDDKSNESDSVGNQRKLIENFVAHNPDIEVVSEKIDDGYSGILFDRPAFKEMMQDITDGKINCVIVKDLSRLGREYIETGRYLRRVFPAYGVRFIAINDNIDTARDSNGDDLAVSVKNIMNEAYCRDISIKTRSSLDIKRRNGDFVGAFTVYGYLRAEENRNKLEIDPYAANIVRTIFRMRLEGSSASYIAGELNRLCVLSPLAYKKNKGLPCAKGGYADKEECKWSATTIIRILKDETYTGVLVQGKQGTPHYKLKTLEQHPVSEWIRVPDAHDAIIERNDFDLVQRIRHLDTRTAPDKGAVYLFSGILICGCCGSRMTRKTNRVAGKEYHYYYCPTGKKHGCEHPVMLKESDLSDCVRDCLKGHIDNVSSLEALLSGIDQKRINQQLAHEYAEQIAESERQLEKVLEFKSRLYENLVQGILNKEEFSSFKGKYSAEAERIKAAVAELQGKLTDVMENRSERNRWMAHFAEFSTLETLDRKAVVQLIQSITVLGKQELEIHFNYDDEYKKALSVATEAELRKVG